MGVLDQIVRGFSNAGTRSFMMEGMEQGTKIIANSGEHAAAKIDWKGMPLWQKPFVGAKEGFKFNYNKAGLPMLAAVGALQVGMAPRGHKAGRAMTFALTQLPSSLIGGAVGSLVGMPGLGAMAASFLLDPITEKLIGKPIQNFVELARGNARLEMGGGYVDSQGAATMRQLAQREMGQSMLNARHWLGKEGAFMHQ